MFKVNKGDEDNIVVVIDCDKQPLSLKDLKEAYNVAMECKAKHTIVQCVPFYVGYLENLINLMEGDTNV